LKIFGIICEYDPLHYGHIRHIEHIRKSIDNNCLIVCIMSGNFVQRGLPACMEKFTRAKHAIMAGADAVIELPTLFSSSSAKDFACGGVKILNQLNVDTISCGSELGDAKKLMKISDIISESNQSFNNILKEFLANGYNYPTAISLAEKQFCNTDILSYPNNLLAIEYINAIKKLNANISFDTIKRTSNYGDENNFDNCSSSAIRKALKSSQLSQIKKHTPDFVYKDLSQIATTYQEKFENLIPLIMATKAKEELEQIADVSEGIENLLTSKIDSNFSDYVANIKSKRYTRAKINRILLYSVLNITKELKEVEANIPLNILAIKNDNNVIREINTRVTASNLKNDYLSNKISTLTQKADTLYRTMYKIVFDKDEINKLKKY